MRRKLLKGLGAAGTLSMLAAPSLAQTAGFPVRPLRMIVPFAAGGGADVVARLMAQGMGEQLGQPVTVENRGGSGGVLGSEAALAAPADGYTFVFHTLSSAVLNAGLYRNLSFDVRRAFQPVSLVGLVPNVVLVNTRLPAQTLLELVALLRASPGRYSYASSGNGTITHLSAHLLLGMIGAQALHVPYRGSGPALQDLAAGTADMMVDTMAGVLGLVQGGQIRALAMTTTRRSAALPDVPRRRRPGCRATRAPTGTPSMPPGTPRSRWWRGLSRRRWRRCATPPFVCGWSRWAWSRVAAARPTWRASGMRRSRCGSRSSGPPARRRSEAPGPIGPPATSMI